VEPVFSRNGRRSRAELVNPSDILPGALDGVAERDWLSNFACVIWPNMTVNCRLMREVTFLSPYFDPFV